VPVTGRIPLWSRVRRRAFVLPAVVAAGLIAAYAFSYYFSVHAWIYLLLRKSADLTDYDDVYRAPAARPAPAVPDKIEPDSGR